MDQPEQVRVRVRALEEPASLCDALDKLLDTGAVVSGEIAIKVADVELLYVALELLACSWEKARSGLPSAGQPAEETHSTKVVADQGEKK